MPEMTDSDRQTALDFLLHIRLQPFSETGWVENPDHHPDSPKLGPKGEHDEDDVIHEDNLIESMPVYNRRLCQLIGRDDFRNVINKSEAVVHVTPNLRSLFAVSSLVRFDIEEAAEEEDPDRDEDGRRSTVRGRHFDDQRASQAGPSERAEALKSGTIYELTGVHSLSSAVGLSEVPFCLGCFSGYDEEDEKIKKKGTSYKPLLDEAGRLYTNLENEDGVQDPFLLDDPELRHGKDQAVLRYPSWTVSVIPYVKETDLKEELNEQFMLEHEAP